MLKVKSSILLLVLFNIFFIVNNLKPISAVSFDLGGNYTYQIYPPALEYYGFDIGGTFEYFPYDEKYGADSIVSFFFPVIFHINRELSHFSVAFGVKIPPYLLDSFWVGVSAGLTYWTRLEDFTPDISFYIGYQIRINQFYIQPVLCASLAVSKLGDIVFSYNALRSVRLGVNFGMFVDL
ncbi:MAG: hypothetical protein HPY53_17125 [Brevinematales bacterium]|nr:hypothetical protein [Brevinematales bacterium]